MGTGGRSAALAGCSAAGAGAGAATAAGWLAGTKADPEGRAEDDLVKAAILATGLALSCASSGFSRFAPLRKNALKDVDAVCSSASSLPALLELV